MESESELYPTVSFFSKNIWSEKIIDIVYCKD